MRKDKKDLMKALALHVKNARKARLRGDGRLESEERLTADQIRRRIANLGGPEDR